jgi:hypothetical protein
VSRRRGATECRSPSAAAPGDGAATPVAIGDRSMDPLDRIVGRAYLDLAFRLMLLRWPRAALVDEPLPDELRDRLSAITAADMPEFAAIALRGYRPPSGRPAPPDGRGNGSAAPVERMADDVGR